MLKWFRLYNKHILAVGGSLLMVAFLIQPVLSMFQPNPGSQVIGTIGREEIKLADQQHGATQIAIIRNLHPLLGTLCPEDGLAWLLMLREAGQIGVSASQYEVNELLTMLNISDAQVGSMARQMGVKQQAIRDALLNWIILQHYQELMVGAAHEKVASKLGQMAAVYQQIGQMAGVQGPLRQYYMSMLMQELSRQAAGQPRVSEPVLQRFVWDQQSTVKATLMPVPMDSYSKDLPEPTPAALKELFDRYRDDLPGTSQPYGFGYRLPRRVKIEYLWLPLDRVKATVTIDEAQAVTYYDEHQDRFREPAPTPEPAADQSKTPPPPPAVKPYEQVRELVLELLKEQEAQRLADQWIKAAAEVLTRDSRHLEIAPSGYRTIPDGFEPRSLEDVAGQLQRQFGVLPDVRREDRQWLTMEELNDLPGIGAATVIGRPTLGFSEYVRSARSLEPPADHPALALRLQVKLPSMPLRAFDGGRFVFRLIDAAPQRSAESMDEVIDQVRADARRLDVYRRALADRPTWKQKLETESLPVLARELDQALLTPPAFPRRDITANGLTAPDVEGVGRDATFVDGVFDVAQRAAVNDLDLSKVAPDKRSDVIGSDLRLTVYLVRVDEFSPVTEGDFARLAGMPRLASWFSQSLAGDTPVEPFALTALARRVGYQSKFPLEDRKPRSEAP